MMSPGFVRSTLAATALLLAGRAVPAAAQSAPPDAPIAARAELFAGTELERYLRVLQVAGEAPIYPWSIRAFAPGEVDSLLPRAARHPWAARYDLTREAPAQPSQGRSLRIIRPSVALRYNSTFPFGRNDGAVWAGRGLTTAVQAGVAARWGPVSLTLAPIAFRAENASFPLQSNGQSGALAYANAQFWSSIDLPQRFGDGAYQRVDPGQSTLRVDLAGVTLGASTANMWWGPASEFPFLLGNNAAGFPHVFVGTQRPTDIWIGRVHARVMWGQLEQSGYFDPATDPSGITRARRFAAGLVGVFEPRGIPGLELGGARFFHAPWPDEGLPGRYIGRPFQVFVKRNIDEVENHIPTDDRSQDGENQLASVFGRWVFPRGGIEVYFEFGRDDHNWDVRDLKMEPDHQASMLWGLQKTWRRDGGEILALRLESLNYEINPPGEHRGGGAIYTHSSGSNQGHTQRGQMLGASTGPGSGAGALAALDWYRPDGRWTARWTRVLRGRRNERAPDGGANPDAMDVVHSLGVERLLFLGPWDVAAGVTGSYEFNRDFADDAQNLSVYLSVTGLPR